MLKNLFNKILAQIAPFDYKHYTNLFINSPIKPVLPDAKYGVRIVRSTQANSYYRCIGIHHLLPDENRGKRNIYFEVLDKNGQRVKFAKIDWNWEGIRPDEKPNPVILDKPDNEPGGNISVDWGQIINAWVQGSSSDLVTGLSSMHPDEGDGNRLGHHSWLVVFMWFENDVPNPPPDNPPPSSDLETRVADLERRISNQEGVMNWLLKALGSLCDGLLEIGEK